MTLNNETKVGLFFVLSLVLFGLMLEVGNRWKIFDQGIPYTTFLSASTGLKQGDAVKLAGDPEDEDLVLNKVVPDFHVVRPQAG